MQYRRGRRALLQRALVLERMPLALLFCDEVFDAFLAHEEARVRRRDQAASTLESHRQILDHTCSARLLWPLLDVDRALQKLGVWRVFCPDRVAAKTA